MKINDQHLLAQNEQIKQINCTKNTRKFRNGQPDTIIIHYTAGSNAESSANFLSKPNIMASAHVIIGCDGNIIQLVPFDTVAWHAGKSEYNGRVGFNNYSIGIEIDNAGVLEKSGDEYLAWFGKRYPKNEVIHATHRNESSPRYWHTFTQEQIQTVQQLCETLMNKYTAIHQILGHEEISPGRKQDPGPAFPLDKLREKLIQERDSDDPHITDFAFVDVNRLNIREMPNIESNKVMDPLKKDTKVLIQQKYENWYKVKTEIEGWVSADYLRFKED